MLISQNIADPDDPDFLRMHLADKLKFVCFAIYPDNPQLLSFVASDLSSKNPRTIQLLLKKEEIEIMIKELQGAVKQINT